MARHHTTTTSSQITIPRMDPGPRGLKLSWVTVALSNSGTTAEATLSIRSGGAFGPILWQASWNIGGTTLGEGRQTAHFNLEQIFGREVSNVLALVITGSGFVVRQFTAGYDHVYGG